MRFIEVWYPTIIQYTVSPSPHPSVLHKHNTECIITPPPPWCYINYFQHQGSACRENRISILQKPMFMAHNIIVISFLNNFPQVSSQKENSIGNCDRAMLINCLNLTGIQCFTTTMLTLVSRTIVCFDIPWRCWLFFLSLTRKKFVVSPK